MYRNEIYFKNIEQASAMATVVARLVIFISLAEDTCSCIVGKVLISIDNLFFLSQIYPWVYLLYNVFAFVCLSVMLSYFQSLCFCIQPQLFSFSLLLPFTFYSSEAVL